MRLLNTVTALTNTAVSTAVKATFHPIDTTVGAVGLAQETAGVGVGLVRNRINAAPQQEHLPTEASTEREAAHPHATAGDVLDEVKEAADDVTETAADAARAVTAEAAEEESAAKPVDEDPRNHIPGPDVAPFVPPAIDELPEPIVIVAE